MSQFFLMANKENEQKMLGDVISKKVLLLFYSREEKATYRKNILLGACLYFHRVSSQRTSWGGVHGGRHSAGEVAEHSHLIHKLQGEADWVWQGLLKMQSPLRVTHFPQ